MNKCSQVKKNSQTLATQLSIKGYNLITNGTDNHLVLVDLSNKGISGSKLEYICETVDISINKNSVYGDKSALNPGGVRLGASALTTRGFTEDDFKLVADFIDECTILAQDIQTMSGPKLVDFKKTLETTAELKERQTGIRSRVNRLAEGFEFYSEID
mgnify:CR=1 FL=1